MYHGLASCRWRGPVYVVFSLADRNSYLCDYRRIFMMCISAVVGGVQSIVKHRNEVELKQQLVDRGMSADEIERIVTATAVKEEAHHC